MAESASASVPESSEKASQEVSEIEQVPEDLLHKLLFPSDLRTHVCSSYGYGVPRDPNVAYGNETPSKSGNSPYPDDCMKNSVNVRLGALFKWDASYEADSTFEPDAAPLPKYSGLLLPSSGGTSQPKQARKIVAWCDGIETWRSSLTLEDAVLGDVLEWPPSEADLMAVLEVSGAILPPKLPQITRFFKKGVEPPSKQVQVTKLHVLLVAASVCGIRADAIGAAGEKRYVDKRVLRQCLAQRFPAPAERGSGVGGGSLSAGQMAKALFRLFTLESSTPALRTITALFESDGKQPPAAASTSASAASSSATATSTSTSNLSEASTHAGVEASTHAAEAPDHSRVPVNMVGKSSTRPMHDARLRSDGAWKEFAEQHMVSRLSETEMEKVNEICSKYPTVLGKDPAFTSTEMDTTITANAPDIAKQLKGVMVMIHQLHRRLTSKKPADQVQGINSSGTGNQPENEWEALGRMRVRTCTHTHTRTRTRTRT